MIQNLGIWRLQKQLLPLTGICMFPRPRPRFAPGGTLDHGANDSKNLSCAPTFRNFTRVESAFLCAKFFETIIGFAAWSSRKFGHRSFLSYYFFRFGLASAPVKKCCCDHHSTDFALRVSRMPKRVVIYGFCQDLWTFTSVWHPCVGVWSSLEVFPRQNFLDPLVRNGILYPMPTH